MKSLYRWLAVLLVLMFVFFLASAAYSAVAHSTGPPGATLLATVVHTGAREITLVGAFLILLITTFVSLALARKYGDGLARPRGAPFFGTTRSTLDGGWHTYLGMIIGDLAHKPDSGGFRPVMSVSAGAA